jgi:hypothetical protein
LPSAEEDVTQLQRDPLQHEVRPSAGSVAGSRFYIIEPLVTETGYTIQARRVGGQTVIWSCSVSFETAQAFQSYTGNVVDEMIGEIIVVAKSHLDTEFIK